MRIFSSVKLRLGVTIGVATVLVAMLLSYFASSTSRNRIALEQATLLRNTATGMATQLAHDMNTRADELLLLARLQPLQNPAFDNERKRHLLERMRKAYPLYAWIGMADPQGRIVVGTDGLLVGRNVAQWDWFIGGRQGLYFGNVHDAYLLAQHLPGPARDDQPLRLVDIAVPVYGMRGELIGVLGAHLSLDWAFEVRETMLDQLHISGFDLLVLDKDGKMLMGVESLPSLKFDLAQMQIFRGLADQSSHVAQETWPDGGEYIAAAVRETGFRHYPGLGWIVVARRSESAAFAPAQELRQQLLLGGLAASVLFIILGWWFMDRALVPLATIAKAARTIRLEGTNTPIAKPPGRGELAEFSKALVDLTNSLHARNEQLRLVSRVFDESSQGIMITDPGQRILRVNRSFTRITGYTQEEVQGKTPALLHSGRHDETFYRTMWETLRRTGRWRGEIWNRSRDGGIYPESLSIETLFDEAGAVTNYIGMFDDISETKDHEKRLQYLANYDSLTGLPNRHLVRIEAETLLADARLHGRNVCLALIDLHKFKHINDTQGHPAGDAVLKEVAQRFLASVKAGQLLARWEGDEFVVVMPGMAPDAAALQMRALLDVMERPFHVGTHRYHLSLTAGLAHFPVDAESVDNLLRCADTALFRAKRDGANLFRFYEGSMNMEVERFLRIDNALRQTLASGGGGLHMVYQPQFSPDGTCIVSAEALVRWTDTELGPLSPAQFIPIAEESGQILQLGRWIVERVCGDQQQMRASGLSPLPVAVNFSALQLRDPDLADDLQQLCAVSEVAPHDLVIEVTESAIMSDEVAALRNIAALQVRGHPVSIDDFGTGYSSLSYVQKIKPAEIKIDQSFVSRMLTHKDSHNIVSFTVGLARSLGIEVVAEGVEQEAQRAALQALGSVRIQGYLLGRPQPLADFMARRRALSSAPVLRAGLA